MAEDEISAAKLTAQSRKLWLAAAWALWLVPLAVICIAVVLRPGNHSLTDLYHNAVSRWWQRKTIYDGPSGMNYLPQFTLLFGPYHLLGVALSDVLWRCTAAVALAAGILVFCRAFSRPDQERGFFVATLLAMPLCLQALQFGQANAHLAAALLWAAWCLSTRRWWAATLLLWLATAIKPLGLAAMALAWAVYPQIWWRLALGLPVFLLAPFAFGPPGYVWGQYLACAQNLRQCSEVTEHRFADLNGLLRTFGAALAGKLSFAVRATAGGLLMVLCWRTSRACAEPLRALIWLGAAGAFLMLFNPMTEANSYAVLATVLALLAWWNFCRGQRILGWILAVMVLTMGLLPEPLRPLFGNYFALAWYPAMTLGFLAILVWMVLRQPSSVRSLGETAPASAAGF
jgi:alpha-1,2-mannosyltransferase